MIDYNNQFNEEVDVNTRAGVETTDSDYEHWAGRLRGLANQIDDDASLARSADTMADLAGQMATLVPRYRAELRSAPPLDATPPPPLGDFSRIGQEFSSTLVELDRACPT